MTDAAGAFYDRLSAGYTEHIRALVPRYDELLERTVELVAAEGPARFVDVGAGVGELSGMLLGRVPGARAVCLEPSAPMAAEARRALEPFGTRARVLEARVEEYRPEEPLDAAVSTLVLHNLAPGDRLRALSELRGWLRPGALFVWADFVRMADSVLQARVEAFRKRFAAEAGCPADLLELNFRKEAESDHPSTAGEALEMAREAGFDPVDLAWAHDAFVVLVARAPNR